MSNRINGVYPLHIKKFEDMQCINNDFSTVGAINEMICKLNTLGKLTNDVVYDWNNVMKWYLEGGTSGGSGGGNNEGVITLRNDLKSTTAGKGASMIGIQDIYNLFTATNVESALTEIIRKTNTALELQTNSAQLRTDLLSNAVGKGASIVGINDSNNLFESITVEEALTEVMNKINAMSADSANGLREDLKSTELNKGASLVGINDKSNIYSATTVEGALSEVMGVAKSAFQSASDGKQELSTALATKGQTVDPTSSFSVFATAIENIETSGGGESAFYKELTGTSSNATELFVSFNGGDTSFNSVSVDLSSVSFDVKAIFVHSADLVTRSLSYWFEKDFYNTGTYSSNCGVGASYVRVPKETIIKIPVTTGNKPYTIKIYGVG